MLKLPFVLKLSINTVLFKQGRTSHIPVPPSRDLATCLWHLSFEYDLHGNRSWTAIDSLGSLRWLNSGTHFTNIYQRIIENSIRSVFVVVIIIMIQSWHASHVSLGVVTLEKSWRHQIMCQARATWISTWSELWAHKSFVKWVPVAESRSHLGLLL